MKYRKTLAGLLALIVVSSALGGCVIVPLPLWRGGGYHHGHR